MSAPLKVPQNATLRDYLERQGLFSAMMVHLYALTIGKMSGRNEWWKGQDECSQLQSLAFLKLHTRIDIGRVAFKPDLLRLGLWYKTST